MKKRVLQKTSMVPFGGTNCSVFPENTKVVSGHAYKPHFPAMWAFVCMYACMILLYLGRVFWKWDLHTEYAEVFRSVTETKLENKGGCHSFSQSDY